MQEPFVGTWTLNRERSEFDPNHRPATATMRWELDPEGYWMFAGGTTTEGQPIQETPQRFILDGKERDVPGAPGVTAWAKKPNPHTVEAQGMKDGLLVGRATYVVSPDGQSLTATASGTDREQRPFTTKVVFNRQ